ncbi:Pantothenate kinase 2 [Vitis vinifera]|uniref:Pantothenate kinase 2 n=1 Tax=Vitis vinifera TaxID=29760 RepID=A0A438KAX7_VITVI|nr:Pantothenate kinase 2 [Vitis vinifera]
MQISWMEKFVQKGTEITAPVPMAHLEPLALEALKYEPNTIDLADPSELEYWFTVLSEHLPDLVDKVNIHPDETTKTLSLSLLYQGNIK